MYCLRLSFDFNISIAERGVVYYCHYPLDFAVDMCFTRELILTLDTQIVCGLARTQVDEAPPVLGTINITPIHAVEVGIVKAVDRAPLVCNLQLHLVVRLTHRRNTNVRENVVHLFWNPRHQQALLAICTRVANLVSVLQAFQ